MSVDRTSLRSYASLLATYVGQDWPRAVVLGVLLVSSIVLQLASPLLIGHFIDSAAAGAEPGPLLRIAVASLLVAVAGQLVEVVEVRVAENLGMLATNRLRGALTRHCLRLDSGFHSEHTTGELIERIDGDVEALGNFFSRFVVYLLGNGLLLVCTIGYLGLTYWWLGVAAVVVCALVLAVVVRVRNVAVPSWVAARQSDAELFGYVEERIGGAEDLRANGAVAHGLEILRGHGERLRRRRGKAALTSSLTGSVSRLLFTLATAALFAVIIALVHGELLTLGGAYVLYRLSDMLMRPVEELNRQAQDFQQANASILRVRRLLDREVSIVDGPVDTLPTGPLTVEFDRVTFGYDADRPVLRELNLTVPAGRVLGVVGRTGGGKSTLARLLFRFHDPQRGAIRVGGVTARDLRLRTLRSAVGFVTQDVELFRASVRDNLTVFDPAVPDERIRAALAEVGLSSWLAALPDGLDTELAGRTSMSAGQAQLLALARVFLVDPGVLVLDEASALLDPATEQVLMAALRRLAADRTVIVIAHHLPALAFADDILVLENGELVEHGSRADLAADPASRFGAMLTAGTMEVGG